MAKSARNNKPTEKEVEPVQETEVFTELEQEQKSEQEEETVITEAPPEEVEAVFAEGTNEEKIEGFLKDKEGETELNDFLKTLEGLTLKGLRNLLTDMQRDGKLKIKNNAHMELGVAYYDKDAKLHHYDLNKTKIFSETLA